MNINHLEIVGILALIFQMMLRLSSKALEKNRFQSFLVGYFDDHNSSLGNNGYDFLATVSSGTNIWRFHKIGVPPNHPFYWHAHEINNPFGATPMIMENLTHC